MILNKKENVSAVVCGILVGLIVFSYIINCFNINELKSENQQLQDEVYSLNNKITYLSGSEELNTCPLCGSEVTLEENYKDDYVIHCDTCNLHLNMLYRESLDELIERWNSYAVVSNDM